MGPLPISSKGKKYILVVTNIFSKWVEAFALQSTDTKTLATVLVNKIVCRCEVPSSFPSDQGRANLTNHVVSSLCKSLEIELKNNISPSMKWASGMLQSYEPS